MKLGELRGAIRKTKGNPYMDVAPFFGAKDGFRFYLQKTPLLEELERAFPGGKAVETGLTFDVESGHLTCAAPDYIFEGVTKAAREAGQGAAVAQASVDEDDDLLGDVPVLGVSPIAKSDDDDLLV